MKVMKNERLLRFSLCYPLSGHAKVLLQLHLFAREKMFRGVTRMHVFEGEECRIGLNDPMAAIKVQAQGIALVNGRLLSFLPEWFSGFGCQLPNKRMMFIGFAKYPDVIITESGQQFLTSYKDQVFWHSNASTLDHTFSDYPEDCLDSHRLACNLLRYANEFKALRVVEDITGFIQNSDIVGIGHEDELEPYRS